MKLSAKARYGLYASVHLAKMYDKGVVSITDLSQSIDVSPKYLEQVLSLLKASDIVESQRGASGGYSLTHPPQSTSVGKVLRAIEDDLRIVNCSGLKCKKDNCSFASVWSNLQNTINQHLDGISLEQLIEKRS